MLAWALIFCPPAQISTLIELNKEEEGVGSWRQLDLEEEVRWRRGERVAGRGLASPEYRAL